MLGRGLFAVTAVALLACEGETDARGRDALDPAPDAGAPDSAPRPVSDAAPVPERDATALRASDARVFDGQPSGPVEVNACAFGQDLGDPPPECIAPCLWKVMKPCALSKCCTVEETRSRPVPPTGATTPLELRYCDGKGVLHGISFIPPIYQGAISADGTRCYAARIELASPLKEHWQDAEGNAIAVVDRHGDGTSTVSCGGQVFQEKSRSDPECARWSTGRCVPGKCPEPPK